MKQPLLLLLACVMLVSCSTRYGSRMEAQGSANKWITEGGYYKVENPATPECENNDNDYLGNLAEQKGVDCSITYSPEPNRICKDDTITRQFACFSLDEKTKPEWTFFKY